MMENKIEELEKQLENVWEEAKEKAQIIENEIKQEKRKNAMSLRDVTGLWFKVDLFDGNEKPVASKLFKITEHNIDDIEQICLDGILIEEDNDSGFQIYPCGFEGKLVSKSENSFTLVEVDCYNFLRVFTEITPETGFEEIEEMYKRTIEKLKSC